MIGDVLREGVVVVVVEEEGLLLLLDVVLELVDVWLFEVVLEDVDEFVSPALVHVGDVEIDVCGKREEMVVLLV